MDALHSIVRNLRTLDLRHNGAAFVMLAISLFALYSNLFVLVVIPLMWMGYRIGKEIGRQEANTELVQGTAPPFPDQRQP